MLWKLVLLSGIFIEVQKFKDLLILTAGHDLQNANANKWITGVGANSDGILTVKWKVLHWKSRHLIIINFTQATSYDS